MIQCRFASLQITVEDRVEPREFDIRKYVNAHRAPSLGP
jgi:hypothetical protein